MYDFIKKYLFKFDPEFAHALTLNTLKVADKIKLLTLFSEKIILPYECMGLHFKNPVGLAAGFDKNGDYIDVFDALGFGFIEIGTVTKNPQMGNPKPRLFRLEKEAALINRLGFNNKGIDYLIAQVKKTNYQGILGINIGKNRDTPLEKALEDYLYLFQKAAPVASYITINISSPNTENLRDLQQGKLLKNLLSTLKSAQKDQRKYVPLVVKISPDLTVDELKNMADIFLEEQIDGVIATNTTLDRSQIEASMIKSEKGGLSGKPLFARSTLILSQLHELLEEKIPIIGCGGILDSNLAQEKIKAGASLLQIYTGFIYKGPVLIREINKSLRNFA